MKKLPIIAVPSNGNGGLNEIMHMRFGRCDSITIATIENNNVKAIKAIPIYVSEEIGNLGIYVANIVINNSATGVIVKYIGSKAFQSLFSQNIKIFQAPHEKLTIKQSIELYIQGNLQELTEPNAHLINK